MLWLNNNVYDKDKHTNILSLCLSQYRFCLGVFVREWHADMKAADATVAGIGCFFCAAQALPPTPPNSIIFFQLRCLKDGLRRHFYIDR